MHYIREIENYKNEKRSAVTLGKFDGLHRGHMKLVGKVQELAANEDVCSIVCSFDMRPLFQRIHAPAKILMTCEERREFLKDKVDYLIDCPFTKEFSAIEAEDFIEKVLVGALHASYVVVGEDFCFGHGKRGNVHMLAKYAEQYGYELIVFEKERYKGQIISSTRIREALSEGNMTLAKELLGYPYTFTGVVSHGKQIGRRIGVPTLNIIPDEWKMIPPNGVYFTRVQIDGKWFDSIGNVGVKPTVTDSDQVVIECYLFEYEGDAYEKTIMVELHEFRRPEQKFGSIEEMKETIVNDIEAAKEYFKNRK
jgi:riboflavin kinase/FMN adenylyltransferase